MKRMKRRERIPLTDRICVFCMQKEGTTDEHIIPRSIGGEIVIKNGTCIECLRKIQIYESKLLSTHYSSAQALLGIKTGSGRMRTSLKGLRWKADFNSAVRDNIQVEDHSGVISTVNFERPGIEVGRAPQEGFGSKFTITMTQIAVGADVPSMSTFAIGDQYDIVPFLAKIAHAYWVSKEGPYSAYFKLKDLILEQDLSIAGYLVGKCDKILPNNDLHVIQHRKVFIKGEHWGCVDIALFSCFNLPEFQARYTVYIGKLTQAPYIFLQPHRAP